MTRQVPHLLLILLCPLLSFSQLTQLTDFDDGGSNFKNHLQTVNGQPYLIQVDQNDIVYSYTLSSPEEKALLHTEHLPGSYSEIIRINGKTLSYGWIDKLYSYDFIADELSIFELQEDHYISSVWDSRGEVHLVQTRNDTTNAHQEIIYDPDIGLIILDDNDYSQLFDGHVLKRKRLANGQTQHLIYNYLEGTFDTLLTQSKRVPFQEHEGNIYYVDSTGMIYQYNLNSKVSQEWIDSGLDQGNRIITALNNDNLVLSTYEETGSSDSRYTNYYKVYDMLNGNLINETNQVSKYKLTSVRFINDIITVNSTLNDLLFLYNYRLNIRSLYSSKEYVSSGLINNTYLLNYFKDFGVDPYYELIDIQTFVRTKINIESAPNGFDRTSFVEFDEEILLSLDRVSTNGIVSLYDLSLSSKTIKENDKIDESSSGFPPFSDIEILKDGVVITDNESGNRKLFYYSENSGIQFLSDLGYGENNLVVNENLYFQSSGTLDLNRFDGENTYTLLDSVGTIEQMSGSNRFIYFSNNSNNLYRYEFSTESLLEITEVESIGSLFVVHNHQLYYSDGNKFLKLDIEGEKKEIIDSYIFTSTYPEQNPIFYQDQVIFTVEDGMYIYNEDEVLLPLLETNLDSWSTLLARDENTENILVANQDVLVHYNGNSVTPIDIDSTSYLEYIGNNYFLFSHKTNGESLISSYNTLTAEVKPFLFKDEFVVEYLESGNKNFLITRKLSNEFRIYEADATYSQSSLIMELNSNSTARTNKVSTSNGTFFRLGDNFLIWTNEEFNLLEVVRTTRYDSSVPLISNDVVYFLANDVVNGKQLYSYNFDVSSIELHNDEKRISIYPNPSNNIINVEIAAADTKETDYTILTTNGQIIKTGKLKNAIDITDLPIGIYVLQISYSDKIWNKKFIKQANE